MYKNYPTLISKDEWFNPHAWNQHLSNVKEALFQISGESVRPKKLLLDRHLHYVSTNKKFVVVVVPWPGHPNFCLNFEDKQKLCHYMNKDNLQILFGKFLPNGFTLLKCKNWNSIDFNSFEIKDSDINLGTYFFIKRGYVETSRESINEFDGILPISTQKVFEFDATTTACA